MKISRKTCRSIFLVSLGVCVPLVGICQTIDLAGGLSEVDTHLGTATAMVLKIILYPLAIVCAAGLVKTVSEMFTEQHGNSWHKALGWFGGILFIVLALYIVNYLAP